MPYPVHALMCMYIHVAIYTVVNSVLHKIGLYKISVTSCLLGETFY